MSQEKFEQRFKVEAPARLKLSNIRGSVDIQPGEDGEIQITAVKYPDTGNEGQTDIVLRQDEDGRVVAKTDYQTPVMNWFGLHKPCKVDYVVRVPRECEARVSGVSCSISIRGIQGTIDVNSVSGGLSFGELSGFMKFNTVSGSISATKLEGELDANSVSGRVRIMESKISEAVVKTVSGGVVLETPLTDGSYHFKGVSGCVTLVVPVDTACSVRYNSVSGRAKTSLPVTRDQRYGSKGSFEIQGGGPEVTGNFVSGSLKVVTSEDEKIVEQRKTPEPAAQPKNQMAILRKIENGEISVDEAIQQLNA